jgi:hypothetical protein
MVRPLVSVVVFALQKRSQWPRQSSSNTVFLRPIRRIPTHRLHYSLKPRPRFSRVSLRAQAAKSCLAGTLISSLPVFLIPTSFALRRLFNFSISAF